MLCDLKKDGGMSFRDLAKFNIALLSKQSSRLLENTGSLSALLIWARYYLNSIFLKSNLGANPSMTWRSIWSAKGLIKYRLKWRIRSGLMVSIWEDHWLLGTEMVTETSKRVPIVKRICDLIIQDSNCWNSDLIRSIFGEDEAKAILGIPLPKNTDG